MEWAIVLVGLYCLQLLFAFLALKASIKYLLKYSQIKLRQLDNNQAIADNELQLQPKCRNWCHLCSFFFWHYTLAGVLFSNKRGHAVFITFSYAASSLLTYFGVHWSMSGAVAVCVCLACVAARFKWWKCQRQWAAAGDNKSNKSRIMTISKAVLVVYVFLTIATIANLLFLLIRVLRGKEQQQFGNILVASALAIAVETFLYKPLLFAFTALPASLSELLPKAAERQNQYFAYKQKQKQGPKGVINVSQEQLNDFLKEGEEELKETKSIFATSSFTAQGNQIESQFFKSKSINHIANKEFFILPDYLKQSHGAKLKVKQKNVPKFFAIGQLQIDTQCQLDCEKYARSLEESNCKPRTLFSQINKRDSTSKSISQTKKDPAFSHSHNGQRSKQAFILSQQLESEGQNKPGLFTQKDKRSKKADSKQLVKVEQLQTETQEEAKEEGSVHLRQHNRNSAHRYRPRKRRQTATQAGLQQENLIKAYLYDNKQQIQLFRHSHKSQHQTSQTMRHRTGKRSQGRCKPIVHQSFQQPKCQQLTACQPITQIVKYYKLAKL